MPTHSTETFEITLAIIREGPNAWLCFDPEEEDEDEAHWLAKSQVPDFEELTARHGRFRQMSANVPVWICRANGWI